MAQAFPGFHPRTIQFLDELAAHNDREWFARHKQRYEQDVLEPSLAFIEAMAAPLSRISKEYLAVPKRTGGSLMRIYRDTRFSADKSPYKTNIGIHFRHRQAPRDVHAPGFYVHLSPEECFLGSGIWQPDAYTANKIRTHVDHHAATWKKLARNRTLLRDFAWVGDSLKRPPRGFSADHPLLEDLKRKDFLVKCDLDFDEVFGDAFPKHVAARFRATKALMKFLCDAVGLPFS